MKRPEILAPAGDMEKLDYAIRYGADAVYLSGRQYGMRTASANFSNEQLRKAVEQAHQAGVKVYVTCNTMPRTQELEQLPGYFMYLEEIGADGVIVADLGVLSICKRTTSRLPVHISTQTSIVNAESARMWHELGASELFWRGN